MKTFNIEQAAEFLNISTDTMKDLAGSGVVPGAKIGKAWVFADELLEEYLREEIRQQTAERRGLVNAEPTKIPTAYTKTVRRGRQARIPPPLRPLPEALKTEPPKRGRPARKPPSLT